MAVEIPHFDDPKQKVAWIRAKTVELSVNSNDPAKEAERSSLDAAYRQALEEAGLDDWQPVDMQRHPEVDPFVLEHLTPAEPTE